MKLSIKKLFLALVLFVSIGMGASLVFSESWQPTFLAKAQANWWQGSSVSLSMNNSQSNWDHGNTWHDARNSWVDRTSWVDNFNNTWDNVWNNTWDNFDNNLTSVRNLRMVGWCINFLHNWWNNMNMNSWM